MTLENARVSRMAVFVALMMAAAMVGVPSFLQIGGMDAGPVGEASAAPEDYTFSVGVIDYGGSMATMNPFLYTMAAEWMTIWPCYSTLIMFDINDNYIGDLAESWDVTADGLRDEFGIAGGTLAHHPSNQLVAYCAENVPHRALSTMSIAEPEVRVNPWLRRCCRTRSVGPRPSEGGVFRVS